MTKPRNYGLPITVLALALGSAAFGQNAGTVSFATGSVTAERQPAETLARGDTVLVEDFVITGDASRAQLVFVDDARLAIRPNSRVQIAEYAFASDEAAPGSAVSTTDDNSSVLNLVKGGFRAITGAIGDEDPSDYEVRTAVGVLGIRGTNFAVLFCNGDCEVAPGVTPGAAVADGLYIMVTEGDIFFTNEVATLELTAGDFAFIPLDTRVPGRLDTTPPVFIDDSDLRFEDDLDGDGIPDPPDDDAPPAGFDEALGTRRTPESGAAESSALDASETEQSDPSGRETPAQPIQGIDRDGSEVDLTPGGPPDPQNRSISYSTGPLGAQDVQFSGTFDNAPGQYALDGNNDLTRFANDYPARTGIDVASLDIGTAANVESGFDSMTVLRWGRWSGGIATATLSDSSVENIDLTTQSLHWVTSPEWSAPPVMPVTGQANYSLIGATSPTDNFGNVGVLGDATFVADFTNMNVFSTLDLMINGQNWLASGQGGIGMAADPVLPPHMFNGSYNAISIDGITGGFGQFSGFFSATGATSDPSFPGGVGLTFTLQDMGGLTTVSGAAVFGSP